MLPRRVRWFRRVARPFFRGLFRLLARVRIEGVENVPERGGYLVTPNHVSLYDPPLVLSFWPRDLEIAGAVAVLERPFQGQLMRLYGALRVHRGGMNRELIGSMVQALKAGLPVYIAPEGRRSHSPGMVEAHEGAAYIAAKAGVPVVPVGITGTEDVLPAWKHLRRPSLKMIIGKPLDLPPVELRSPARKQGLRANTQRIMLAIARLLPERYHGLYRVDMDEI